MIEQDAAPSVFGDRKRDGAAFGPDYGRQRIRLRKGDEVNPYADMEDARLGMDPRLKRVVALAVALAVVFVFAVTFPVGVLDRTVHPTGYTAAEFLDDWRTYFAGFFSVFAGQESFYALYFWEMVAALLAGAAMGLSGGVYQGAMKNALASPTTLGVTSGGSLGLILYGLTGVGTFEGSMSEYEAYAATLSPFELVMESWGSFICCLLGCLVVVLVVMLIAYIAGRGHVSNVSLVIAGQVLTSVIGVVITCVSYYAVYVLQSDRLQSLINTSTTVSFGGLYTMSSVAVFAVPLIACMAVVLAMSGRLSLLAFSDDEARSMGVSTRALRNTMVALCTVMTALVISFTGPIGFIGFMVPHIARRIIGPEFRYLLPSTALVGAIMVVVVNCIANLGIPGIASGSTGLVTSVVGCVFFIVMALRTRGESHAEWF